MLPPGHIAGGYLAGKIAARWIPGLNQPEYLWLSAFFGFFPDLDTFWTFFKTNALRFPENPKYNHRTFWTHAPLVYAATFIVWYWIFPSSRLVAWTFLLGTESHFILDTAAAAGIAWFYPFSTHRYGRNLEIKFVEKSNSFFAYWWRFTKYYIELDAFKIEVAVIVLSLISLIFIK